MPTQTHDWIKTEDGRPLLVIYARLATTANVNLTTDVDAGSTLDGVTIAAGDVLLVKDHATGTTKGLYVAPAASGTATRHHLMRSGVPVHGVQVRVLEGTTNGGKTFWCRNAAGAGVVGTDALTFATDAAGVTDHGALTGLTDADHPAGAIAFTATDKLLGRSSSGAGAGEEIACTAAGRAIIDDADAAAQRTTLGLGSLATVTPTGTPDGAKFLRDDYSWQTPAGGGGSETVTHLESGRLTLTTATPITASNVTGSTIYWTPYKASHVRTYYSSAWSYRTAAEASLALSGMTTGRPQDFFLYWTGSALALERVQWSSATARATALTLQDNIYVKSGDATRLYVGTGLAASATTIKDRDDGVRGLWNFYNRVERETKAYPTNDFWQTNGGAWRAADGNTANAVQFVSGLGTSAILVRGQLTAYGGYEGVCIGVNSATGGPTAGDIWGSNPGNAVHMPIPCQHSGIARLGESTYYLCERPNNGFIFGDYTNNGTNPDLQSAIHGRMVM